MKYFEMVPVARVISGITFLLTLHMRSMCVVQSLYYKIFFLDQISPEIAISANKHHP
jgi:hypothetical protein